MRLLTKTIIPVMYSGSYFILAALLIALAVLAFREDVPDYAREPPCFLPLRKMAVFLYKNMLKYREKRRKKGKDFLIPGENGVRNDFSVLYPSMKARRREIVYGIKKTERILLLMTGGILFAGVLHFHSLGSGVMQKNGGLERAPVGGEDRRISVTALPKPEQDGGESPQTGAIVEEGEEKGQEPESEEASWESPQTGAIVEGGEEKGLDPEPENVGGESPQTGVPAENSDVRESKKDFGTYTFTLHARRLTLQEAETLAEEILKQFPECLLGENADPENIRVPLEMPETKDVSPFVPEWESSRYSVLDTDGSIFNSEYTDDQAEQADLTLYLTYGDWRFEKKMSFTVRARIRDEETRFREEIEKELKTAEKESSSRNVFVLPAEADGIALDWEEKIEDVSTGILFMGILVCMCAWYMMDRRLHEQTIARSRQLALDYPKFISRIVLYLGAGMSVRNVFYKCAAEYREQREAEEQKKRGKKCGVRYLYEEILLVCNELDSGISETEAYMHFGRRCHSRQYTKLCSLLVQNLRRGNDTLLAILQEEAQSSFEERKNLARELGEEAGTKLLLPMMIMLGVTMLIIIVPAYFSFSM